MNCAFEVETSEISPGPIDPANKLEGGIESFVTIEGLHTLEEFCQNTPVVNNIYTILEASQCDGILDIIQSLQPNLLSTLPPTSPKPPESALPDGFAGFQSGENALSLEFLPPLQENLQQGRVFKQESMGKTSNSVDQVNQQSTQEPSVVSHQSFADTRLEKDENDSSNNSFVYDTVKEPVTYTELTSAVPPSECLVPLSTSAVDLLENAMNESNLPRQLIGATQEEIDMTMQSTIDCLGQLRPKDLQATLDLDTVECCLEDIVNRPILICHTCYRVFDAVAPFQVHVNTCCDPPRVELKTKMDHVAMDMLARGLWKQVFLKILSNHPTASQILKQEDQLYLELDQIWEMSAIQSMIRCRNMFIKAAVSIVTRKWCATAYANEVQRLRSRISKVPLKKRPKKEPGVEENTSPNSTTQSSSKKIDMDCIVTGRYPLRRRVRKIMSDTDFAIEAILGDCSNDFADISQQYHFTPETPVSEHGQDVLSASPVLSKRRSKDKTLSENTAKMEADFEPEIERNLREKDAVNDEAAAAAAENLEGLDERDNWDNGQLEEPVQLGEGEYVVREILQRRLVNENIDRLPTEEDFEYLVAWDGFGDEENTWEPYVHLKHCDDKLKQFHDRLKVKSMRKRKGKRT